MSTEKGICPATGEICEARLACERGLEGLAEFLEELKSKRLSLVGRFAALLGMDVVDIVTPIFETAKDQNEGYLILNCNGQDCIVRQASEKDQKDQVGIWSTELEHKYGR